MRDDAEQPRAPAALAATGEPVELRVQLIDDERTPEGMVCMGTFRHDRLIARAAIAPEGWAFIEAHHLLEGPVQVVLVAREASPGLQCQLYAMVAAPVPDDDGDDDDDGDEPWAASVPKWEGEGGGAGGTAEGPARVVALPLGHIVRFERDRVHRDNLALEAADVLRKVVDGRTAEVVDKAIEELFGL